MQKFIMKMLHKRRKLRPSCTKLLSLIPDRFKKQFVNLNKSLDSIIIDELNESQLVSSKHQTRSIEPKRLTGGKLNQIQGNGMFYKIGSKPKKKVYLPRGFLKCVK